MDEEDMWEYNCPKFSNFEEAEQCSSGDSFFDVDEDNKHFKSLLKSARKLMKYQDKVFMEEAYGRVDHPRYSFRSLNASPERNVIDSDNSYSTPRWNLKSKRKVSPPSSIASSNSKTTSKQVTISEMVNRLTKTATKNKIEELKNFWATLRHNSPVSDTFRSGVTKPQPFNLTLNKKRQLEPEVYVTMAEQLLAFEQGPKRLKLSNDIPKGPKKLTRPKTPKLEALKRKRNHKVMSYQEKEDLLVEEMKKYKFKATPLDHQIVEAKYNTQVRSRANSFSESQETFKFHARPIPKTLFEGPTGVKSKGPAPLTKPISPNFIFKGKRKGSGSDSISSKENQIAFKANPLPDFSNIFMPKNDKKATKPMPFSFEQINKERQSKKEDKIAKLKEEEAKAHIFIAQPLPSFENAGLPEKIAKPLTEPEPFQFESDILKAAKAVLKVAEEPKPKKVVRTRDQSSHQPLLEVTQFKLHTEVRASERLRLKQHQDEQEALAEIEREKQRQLKEEQDQKDIIELRHQMVHKARPMPYFKTPRLPAKQKAKLTSPETPMITSKRRRLEDNY